ncbi:MAG: hypothetical protein IKF78_01610 [Atopobiaceae bacterium]|nr:hypothetical protein [Atopobiaceae bacterium]
MWAEFAFALLVSTLLLFGPGYPFMRGLGLSRPLALACAPLYCVCMYVGLPMVYYELGVASSVLTVLLPTVVVAACAYAIAWRRGSLANPRFACSAQADLKLWGRTIPFDVAMGALYVGLAAIVCLWVFVSALPQADTFYPRYDNQTHLNLIRSFMDSGKWSSLHTSSYLASPPNQSPLSGAGGFYPAAWHCLVVLTCLITGAPVTVGVNASVVAMATFVFPLAACAFMRSLFRQRRAAMVCGAFVTTAFASWPWHFVVTGPLYPNQLSLSLLFSALAVVVLFVRGEHARGSIARFVAFCLVSVIALALSHSSAVFSAYVFLAAFGFDYVLRATRTSKTRPSDSDQNLRARLVRVALLAGYCVVVVGFWVLCLHIPALQSVVMFQKGTSDGLLHVMVTVGTLKFGALPLPQIGMCLVCIAGIVAVLKQRSYAWLLLPVAFFAVATVVSFWNDGTRIAHYLGGFWYTDSRRLSVNLSLFLMPVAAAGAAMLFEGARKEDRRVAWACRIALVGILLLVYVPGVRIPRGGEALPVSQLQAMRDRVESSYGNDETQVYSKREMDFVRRAMEVVPPNALVVNAAPDGSVWAYGTDGINTLYRSHRVVGQSDEAKVMREHLCEYATNPKVQEVVRHMGASYVLVLDKGVSYEDGSWIPQFVKGDMKKWAGIMGIDDQTPGFSVELAEGDEMRLYRIEPLG